MKEQRRKLFLNLLLGGGCDAKYYDKKLRLEKAMDQINKNNGSETIVLGGQQYTRGKAAIKREQSGTCPPLPCVSKLDRTSKAKKLKYGPMQ